MLLIRSAGQESPPDLVRSTLRRLRAILHETIQPLGSIVMARFCAFQTRAAGLADFRSNGTALAALPLVGETFKTVFSTVLIQAGKRRGFQTIFFGGNRF